MEQQTVTTSMTPAVVINVQGNLTLQGWDKSEVLAKSSPGGNLTLEQQDDQVSISCKTNCTVYVPVAAEVHIERVAGHATVNSLDDDLTITEIAGHLSLLNVGATDIGSLHGHLTAKNISGDLHMRGADGNATVREVRGDFSVDEAVRGNLSLEAVDGDASAIVYGNATLRLDPVAANDYTFEAHGNLLCRLPEDVSARLEIPRAARVLVKMPDVNLPPSTAAPLELTLGAGEATLTLSANGEVLVSSQPSGLGVEDIEVDLELGEDFESLAETISQQVTQTIEAQMEMLEQQLEAQLSHLTTSIGTVGLSPEQAERIAQRAREASQRASARAQEKMRRAQEKLQRKLETARRRAEARARAAEAMARDRRRRPETFEWAPPPPPPPQEPVSDAERLMILQMLEQQKITAAEAEQLLAALESR